MTCLDVTAKELSVLFVSEDLLPMTESASPSLTAGQECIKRRPSRNSTMTGGGVAPDRCLNSSASTVV